MAFFSADTVVLNHVPSPKFQFHEVGEPVDVSVNDTVRGAVPDVISGVNDATGEVEDPSHPARRAIIHQNAAPFWTQFSPEEWSQLVTSAATWAYSLDGCASSHS
jgi:hypothetical protein